MITTAYHLDGLKGGYVYTGVHRPVNMGSFKGTMHRKVIGLKPHLRALSLLPWGEVLGLVTLQAHRNREVTLTAARAVLQPDRMHTSDGWDCGKDN